MVKEERIIFASIAGEIVLKSHRVRSRFEQRLLRNIRSALRKWNVNKCKEPYLFDTRVIIGPCLTEEEYKAALDAVLHVFGIHGATIAYRVKFNDLNDLAEKVKKIAGEWVKGKVFAVRAKRSGREPFTSLEMAKVIGAALYPLSRGVNLDNPEVEVYVEARGNTAFIHQGLSKGPKGLPIGVEGRALALFSGGLDSPLAAWMIAKRGVKVDLLHFVLASSLSVRDALRVALLEARLWLHGYNTRLYVVDFRFVTQAIIALVKPEYRQVVLRLAMYDAATILAKNLGYKALVTGESLGQVSSQTLPNIYALEVSRTDMIPILRPLIGLDKEEIIDLMRRINLYDEAAKTKEYCAIAKDSPVTTKADYKVLSEEYSKIRNLVYSALKAVIELELSDNILSKKYRDIALDNIDYKCVNII